MSEKNTKKWHTHRLDFPKRRRDSVLRIFRHDSIFHALLTRLWSRCENFQGAAFQWLSAYFFLTVKTVLIACQFFKSISSSTTNSLPCVSGILKYQLISTYIVPWSEELEIITTLLTVVVSTSALNLVKRRSCFIIFKFEDHL